jgi:hypothetical protein
MEYVVFEKNYLFSQKTPLSTSFFIRQTQSKRHKKYRTHFFREKTEKTFLWSLHKVGGDGLDVICERYIIFSNVCTYIRRMHLSIYNDIQISQSFAIPGLTKISIWKTLEDRNFNLFLLCGQGWYNLFYFSKKYINK